MPVACTTRVIPPSPMARASVAAHSRRERSVNTGDKAACFARRVATSTREPYHAVVSQYKRLMSNRS